MTRPTVWQIASGDVGRNYAWLFRKHDVMFLGPGRYGPYDADTYSSVVKRGEFSGLKIGTVRSFCEEVRPGDFVLLREGHRVTSIGLVPDDNGGADGYRYDDTFDDVYGWDLGHTRRVSWQPKAISRRLANIQDEGGDLFGKYKQQPTFTRVKDGDTLDRISALLAMCEERPLRDPPEPIPAALTLEEIGQRLFFKGLSNQAVDNVLHAIERQRRLLTWYKAQGKESARPDEHEVVAHMILPLLLGLGWSEQLLAIEWHKVDLAAFWGTPTTSDRCVLVCEAKHMYHGLQGVWSQALGYVNKLKLRMCRKILLTQGARFYLYHREGRAWSDEPEPDGYINLEAIRENHIAPANTDAIDTLMALTPAGVGRKVGE